VSPPRSKPPPAPSNLKPNLDPTAPLKTPTPAPPKPRPPTQMVRALLKKFGFRLHEQVDAKRLAARYLPHLMPWTDVP